MIAMQVKSMCATSRWHIMQLAEEGNDKNGRDERSVQQIEGSGGSQTGREQECTANTTHQVLLL